MDCSGGAPICTNVHRTGQFECLNNPGKPGLKPLGVFLKRLLPKQSSIELLCQIIRWIYKYKVSEFWRQPLQNFEQILVDCFVFQIGPRAVSLQPQQLTAIPDDFV